ncbi:sugar phosphate isomerase/epimerase family protein [Microbacterium sp. PMB16]|uniref:sugar phosphate isomerase/epimerase family protein n=1 Tax=Microbacterium sp. PMB16 TaxID=3120157 RepID=UPI003F4B08F3
MRIGIATFARTWEIGVPGFPQPERRLGPWDMVMQASDAGLSLVQFSDNLPLENIDDVKGFARFADEHGISLEAGTRGCRVDNLRRYLALAEQVRSPFVRVVLDSAGDEPDLDEVVRRFGEVRDEYVRAGVTLAVENHDRFRVEELVGLIERCGDWVGICLDTVNSFGALEGPDIVVDALAPHTVNVHLKDFEVVRAAHGMGFFVEGRALGDGRLDTPGVLDAVARFGRAETAVIELWTPYDGDIESTVRTEREWAERSIRYARTLVPSAVAG